MSTCSTCSPTIHITRYALSRRLSASTCSPARRSYPVSVFCRQPTSMHTHFQIQSHKTRKPTLIKNQSFAALIYYINHTHTHTHSAYANTISSTPPYVVCLNIKKKLVSISHSQLRIISFHSIISFLVHPSISLALLPFLSFLFDIKFLFF